jgi:FkbM family methyltransferase
MNDSHFEQRIKIVGDILREAERTLSFTILEIGALPLQGQKEPFHQLLDIFPDSRIIAFEVDKNLCDQLNRNAKRGIRFFPIALGRKEERRPFYVTNNPMCSSLYRPNEDFISLYNNMEVAMLKKVESIETVSLDHFTAENHVESVDFIKIDIQGAELDVFQGGMDTLQNVVAIVSEVEFVHHYVDQPLFGDVCAFLAEQDIMFHKFLRTGGRSLKPIILGNDPNLPVQYIWSDAVFLRHLFKIPDLSADKLLKMGLLAFIYGSPDVTFYCFKCYDEKNGTTIQKALLNLGNK